MVDLAGWVVSLDAVVELIAGRFGRVELAEFAALYQAKGLSPVPHGRYRNNSPRTTRWPPHLDTELSINPTELTSPWQAARASALSFIVGAVLPLVAILIPPPAAHLPITVIAMLAALAVTATISARLSGANRRRVLVRVVGGRRAGIGRDLWHRSPLGHCG